MADLDELARSVEWHGDHLVVIDQTLLPAALELRPLRTVTDVVEAIRGLVVRGAPAIGVCGAFGVVIGLDEQPPADVEAARQQLERVAVRLVAARPTAVNLRWAVERVVRAARDAASTTDVRRRALAAAQRVADDDRASCQRIAESGRRELATAGHILTHCNTGRLATTGLGTALGVVYAKAAAGDTVEVLATETRPLLQGARLTAWELRDAGIPVTLLADAATGSVMAQGLVDTVVVGCDRVARNGDTANKVGTYTMAVLADTHGLPFYVAGPMTSFDPDAAAGADIPIEQRDAHELLRAGGAVIAPDVPALNPAFDVTPAGLITAFITDVGILRRPFEASIAAALEEAQRRGLR
ncbi:MAG TPA: S-methyl-5-thioribose-1-phosphate isomerase [Nitriliruptorales bacterium]|nr:S-methyl-5-thioribose-1-phosphate isomerase [Nitriliruptorales bacterium]